MSISEKSKNETDAKQSQSHEPTETLSNSDNHVSGQLNHVPFSDAKNVDRCDVKRSRRRKKWRRFLDWLPGIKTLTFARELSRDNEESPVLETNLSLRTFNEYHKPVWEWDALARWTGRDFERAVGRHCHAVTVTLQMLSLNFLHKGYKTVEQDVCFTREVVIFNLFCSFLDSQMLVVIFWALVFEVKEMAENLAIFWGLQNFLM